MVEEKHEGGGIRPPPGKIGLRLETVAVFVLFVYKLTFSVIFCLIKRVHVSRKSSSLFILYISTAKPISLVRGILK